MPEAGSIHIGTSGWHYRHWKGTFYPDSLNPSAYLAYYQRYFDTVELNNFFYRLPAREQMQVWKDAVPAHFLYTVKANRFITHLKKLKDPVQPLINLYDRVEVLGEKAGPILFQLPPNWRYVEDRLRAFLSQLSGDYRHVFEFRNPTWFNEAAYLLLQKHSAGLCIYDLAGFCSPFQVTAPFVYVRLHGPDGAYQGSYDEMSLFRWAESIRTWSEKALDVYCYFDNDEAGYAVRDALQLKTLISGGVT